MTVRLAHQTSSAIVTRMRTADGPELMLLLGDDALMPGFCADEGAVIRRIELSLSGDVPSVSTAVRRHLVDVVTTALDVALMKAAGLDPGVAAYVVATLGGLACRHGGHQLQITRGRYPHQDGRLAYDVPLGQNAAWSSSADGIVVTVHRLPDTIAAAVAGRLATADHVGLHSVIEHPLLDAFDLRIESIDMPEWGGARLRLDGGPQTSVRPIVDLLDED